MGLTISEKEALSEATGWSNQVLDHLTSVDEANIYINAGLVERTIAGRPALVRTDIDWKAFNCRFGWLKDYFKDWEKWQTYNNADLIGEGYAPRDANGDQYCLHHIGGLQDSPLAELSWQEHMCDGNNTVLHECGDESRIDRSKFSQERSEYWQARFKAFSPEELEEIYGVEL